MATTAAIIGGVGALAQGLGSFFGGKSQADAVEDAARLQVMSLVGAAEQLDADFDEIIKQVSSNPALYAGRKIEGAPFEPIDLASSQTDAIGANRQNLSEILNLVSTTNQATLEGDVRRAEQLFPDYQRTLGNLSSSAASLSAGQLPFDTVEDIIGRRAEVSGAAGIPGGAGPATLRDLGLSSLDATNQGASLFQQILQAADQFVSPVSRQIAAPQFFTSPQESTQLNLQQAQLAQQSQQNINNLEGQPNPGANLKLQLAIQQAQGRASTQAQIAGIGQPVVPSTLGIASQTLIPGITSAAQSLFGGGGGGFSQGFGSFNNNPGGGFNPQQYNAQAQYYNTFGAGSQPGTPPRAIVVT